MKQSEEDKRRERIERRITTPQKGPDTQIELSTVRRFDPLVRQFDFGVDKKAGSK